MDISYYKKYEPIFGSWKIVREIGEGSFGKVFEIERTDFGYTYKAALKAITVPQSESELDSILAAGMDMGSATEYCHGIVKELNEEFRLMSKLKGNSNVVSYEDHVVVEHTDGIGWDILIRMELLTPLMKYIRSNPLNRDGIIQMGIDICKALELCRKHDIVHRDIKPDNIFVSDDGLFKLGDFGIAKTMEHTTGSIGKKGTYNYMAPEVYKGEPYGSRVDIYSLGIMLYRFLNGGRLPFQPPAPAPLKPSDNERAISRRISGEELPAPVNADAELAKVILKACAYRPEDRFMSPTEMREALEALVSKPVKAAAQAPQTEAAEDKTVGVFLKSTPVVVEAETVKDAPILPEEDTPEDSSDKTEVILSTIPNMEAAKVRVPQGEKLKAHAQNPAPQMPKPVQPAPQRPAPQIPRPVQPEEPPLGKKRKSRPFEIIIASLLCLACLFSIIGLIPAVSDIKNIREYKAADSTVANDGIAQLKDGIAQLKKNEQTYLDDVDTYVVGKNRLEEGEAQLAEGQAKLDAGKQQLAEGQAAIDANTQAYLEGRELIGKMESLMPYVESLAGAVQNVRDFNAGKIGGDADMYLGQLKAAVLNLLANNEAVAAFSEVVGMDIGGILASNPTDTAIIGNVINMYYDGLAQLKQYEDGLAQLADGKKQLAAGEAQLADGKAQLEEDKAQLEEDEAKLVMFEDGEAQLVDGMLTLMLGMTPSYHPYSHEQTVDSLAERLAAEFGIEVPDLYIEDCAANADAETISYANCFNMDAYKELCYAVIEGLYQKDENGDFICAERDGNTLILLDLKKCDLVVENAEAYLENSEADTHGEFVLRVVSYALVFIAAVLGLIAGVIGTAAGITGVETTGKGLGIAAAIMAVGGFVAAIISHYTDFIYGIRVLEGTTEYAVTDATVPGTDVIYSGAAQKPIFLVMVIATILFVIATAVAKKAAKEKA